MYHRARQARRGEDTPAATATDVYDELAGLIATRNCRVATGAELDDAVARYRRAEAELLGAG